MSSKTRVFFLSLSILAILAFSAVGTTTVYADDDAPETQSADTAGACESDSDEENKEGDCKDSSVEETTDDVQVVETPVPVTTEATPAPVADTPTAQPTNANSGTDSTANVQSQPTDTATTTVIESTTPPADSNILSQVPENTSVTVLNTEGEAQPLVTQNAADAIATSDPIWCPATQTTPTPGQNGCTASFTSFDALLTELSNNATTYQGAGTIFVQQGAYAGGETVIDFNAYNLSNISNSDLTVQGGWNTSTNTVDPASTSNLNVPIIIGSSGNPWGGSLTIGSIVITGSNQTGLVLYSQNNINLSNVQVTNSVAGSGAELNAGGDVTINNSNFDRNRKTGASIRAGGNVAISNSTFNNPGSNRLQITGLDIFTSGGSVALSNVQANGNREAGVNIDATGRVSISNSIFSGTKSTTTTVCPGGGTPFCGYGLQVVTQDFIDLDGVVANDNFLWGAKLNAGKDVTIANSVFNGNSTQVPTFIDDTGLFVTSGGGVSLNNVQANNNRLYGANIIAVGDVSINNSDFSNNTGITLSSGGTPTYHGDGLWVMTDGNIFLNGITASNNMLSGAHLEAGADVVISNSTFSNNTTGSAADPLGNGLEIISGGNVFLATSTFDSNQLAGADIQAGAEVFLDDLIATNNGTDGAAVTASCTHLTNGTYTGNGQYGLNLVNSPLTQAGLPVFGSNGAGDIFPATPGACVVTVVTTGGGNTGSVPTGGAVGSSSSAHYAALQGLGNSSIFNNTGNIILVKMPAAGSRIVTNSIFTGKYAYIYTTRGMMIVSLFPISLTNGVMNGKS